VLAKDPDTHAKLAAQFAAHTIKREYWAIVWGKFPEEKGSIEGNIGRSLQNRKMFAVLKRGGKHARTDYFVMAEYNFASLVKYKLHTGRTHQIRVHSTYLKHPIMGDEQYGGTKLLYGGEVPRLRQKANECLKIATRQLLHAKTIGFIHPQTGQELFFDSELPEDFSKVLRTLQEIK
jgi:23S rRNA pseudouridine1911/1915/1917 synthase